MIKNVNFFYFSFSWACLSVNCIILSVGEEQGKKKMCAVDLWHAGTGIKNTPPQQEQKTQTKKPHPKTSNKTKPPKKPPKSQKQELNPSDYDFTTKQ